MTSVRSTLADFVPYSWETPSYEIAERYGLSLEEVVRMDLNTSPYQPRRWLNKLASYLPDIQVNLYPDTSYRKFREALSSYTGKSIDEILVGNGADECLMITAQTFLEKGRKAIISYPSYSYFRICAEVMGAEVVRIRRREDFSDDVEAIIRAADKNTGLIFLCSPNNPTGNLSNTDEIRKILDETEAAVVVDEAYFEYSKVTCAKLTENYPNLIIVRTLSKAFSLAGARVGYALAAEETINHLNKVRPPNSLSIISLELAQIALKNVAEVKKWAAKVVSERKRLAKMLQQIERLRVIESEANFLLVLLEEKAEVIHDKLMSKGLVVRNLSNVIPNALRITVGTPKQNNLLFKTLRKIMEE